MKRHPDLGNTPDEIRRNLHRLIRAGEIVLGGYRPKKIYGRLECKSGKRMKAENRVFFKDEAEAIAAGFRPCAHCLPEKYRIWKAQNSAA